MPEELVARQFWIVSPGHGEIRRAALSPPGPGEVLVRALHSGISRGTESLVYQGRVPESEREAMRAPYQEGDFPGPVKYGYLSVGRVVDGGPGDAAGRLVGRDVFCLFPHQDRYVVPADAVTPLPDGLPPTRAVLAGNMETAVNAVWDGSPGPGDRITVVGAGAVGLLIAWLCRGVPGTDVRVHDVNPRKAGPATELGLRFFDETPSNAGEPASDLVFHASGSPEGLRTALHEAGDEARVVEVSWFGDTKVELRLGEGFHSRRLTLRSSQVGGMPPARRPRWDPKRRMKLALDLLRDPGLDVLVTGGSPFDDLPRVLEDLGTEPGDTLCHRVDYPSEP